MKTKTIFMSLVFLLLNQSSVFATSVRCKVTQHFKRNYSGEYYDRDLETHSYSLTVDQNFTWKVIQDGGKPQSFFMGTPPTFNKQVRSYRAGKSKQEHSTTFDFEYSAKYSNLDEMPSGSTFIAWIQFGGYEDEDSFMPVSFFTDTATCTIE